jgi:hypothetical protein
LLWQIAATTALVTVDASTTPFTTNPDDLFDRTFNDPKVAISDDRMPIFNANLTVLLKELNPQSLSVACCIPEVVRKANLSVLGCS